MLILGVKGRSPLEWTAVGTVELAVPGWSTTMEGGRAEGIL